MAHSWKPFRRSERFHSRSCQASHPFVPFFSRAADDGGQEAQVVYGLYFDSFAIGVQPPKFILSLTYSLFNCLFDWFTDWLIDWLFDWLLNWCDIKQDHQGEGYFFLTTDVFLEVCIFNSLMSLFWAMTLLVTVTYVWLGPCKTGHWGHGCRWKVEGDFGSEIWFLQVSPFACACTYSCVPFSNHPLVYPCVRFVPEFNAAITCIAYGYV